MNRPFIRGKIAIDSMRDNGFINAAYALAELIDNSIQASASRVELICFEDKEKNNGASRATKRLDSIGIFDDGDGMEPETLHLALEFGASENRNNKSGIGKFGMGLPNSSISQCKRVEVWSWTSSGDTYYTYLDVDEIKKGKLELIPEPVEKPIPPAIQKVIGERLPKSGTFVLWTKIDRCRWKTGRAVYNNTTDLVGRMYRYYLANGQVAIKYKNVAYEDKVYVVNDEKDFKANDPLYLLKDTTLPDLPSEYSGETMFEMVGDGKRNFPVVDENGKEQRVEIRYSVLKVAVQTALRRQTNANIGQTVWGKHAKKNNGVSLLRSERELALLPEFIKTEFRDKGRWYGIEVHFPPALDNIFGVTNNKQSAVHFKMISPDEDWQNEGYESEQDFKSSLLENSDPRLQIYEVIRQIKEVEKELIEHVERFDFRGNKDGRKGFGNDNIVDNSIRDANKANESREDTHPTELSSLDITGIKDILVSNHIEEASKKAKAILEEGLNVWIDESPLPGTAFFDVSNKQGLTLLQVNKTHKFYLNIIENIDKKQRDAIYVCLAAWARLERETMSDKYRDQLQRVRSDWGQLLDDYLPDEG